MLTIVFDGIAYGMVLFVLACGLSVTLGLMNFVNLAHGVFAMVGGYTTAILMNRLQVPFLLTLPFAFLVPAVLGLVMERTLYRRLYNRSHLDQVLFTIGLEFSIARLATIFRDVLLGGVLQVLGTIGAVAGVALLAGWEWRSAIFLGFALSLSSTAIVLRRPLTGGCG